MNQLSLGCPGEESSGEGLNGTHAYSLTLTGLAFYLLEMIYGLLLENGGSPLSVLVSVCKEFSVCMPKFQRMHTACQLQMFIERYNVGSGSMHRKVVHAIAVLLHHVQTPKGCKEEIEGVFQKLQGPERFTVEELQVHNSDRKVLLLIKFQEYIDPDSIKQLLNFIMTSFVTDPYISTRAFRDGAAEMIFPDVGHKPLPGASTMSLVIGQASELLMGPPSKGTNALNTEFQRAIEMINNPESFYCDAYDQGYDSQSTEVDRAELSELSYISITPFGSSEDE
jgi:hypothetical protein